MKNNKSGAKVVGLLVAILVFLFMQSCFEEPETSTTHEQVPVDVNGKIIYFDKIR